MTRAVLIACVIYAIATAMSEALFAVEWFRQSWWISDEVGLERAVEIVGVVTVFIAGGAALVLMVAATLAWMNRRRATQVAFVAAAVITAATAVQQVSFTVLMWELNSNTAWDVYFLLIYVVIEPAEPAAVTWLLWVLWRGQHA